jgi:ribosomal protein L19E
MATITNKTRRPLSVLLPGGKKLRLGALASAEIKAKAITHPAVLKLVEAGTVEVVAQSSKNAGGRLVAGASGAAAGRGGGRGIRKTGDR